MPAAHGSGVMVYPVKDHYPCFHTHLRPPIRRQRGWWGLPHAGRRSCRTKAQCIRHPLPGECGNALGMLSRPVDKSPGFACSLRTKVQCIRHPLPGECGNALGMLSRPVDESPGFACSFLSSTTGEHHPGGTVADVALVNIGRGGHCPADAAGRESSGRTHAKQSKRCHSVPPIKRHS